MISHTHDMPTSVIYGVTILVARRLPSWRRG